MYIYTYIAERAPKSAHTWHACTHWHRITCITHLYNTRIWVYTHLDTQVCSPRGHGADALDTQYVYTQFTQYVYTHFDTQVCSPRGHGADDRLECLRRLPKPGCPPPRLACYGYILACPGTCCDSSALMYPAKDDTAVEGACKSDRGLSGVGRAAGRLHMASAPVRDTGCPQLLAPAGHHLPAHPCVVQSSRLPPRLYCWPGACWTRPGARPAACALR